MIVVDANLLIYAYNVKAREHGAARAWLEDILARPEAVRLPWAVIHAFLRLTTSARVLTIPLSIDEATRTVEQWLSSRAVATLEPGSRYWPILRELLSKHAIRGDVVNDAHLAALALEHDATIYSADRDFRRFAGLRVINPLA